MRGIAGKHEAAAMPARHHHIAITRACQCAMHLHRGQTRVRFGPHLRHFIAPGGNAALLPRDKMAARQAPEKT